MGGNGFEPPPGTIDWVYCDNMQAWTHRSCVDEDGDENDEQDDDKSADNVPLVKLPDYKLEGLPWRGEPQEGSGWTTEEQRVHDNGCGLLSTE